MAYFRQLDDEMTHLISLFERDNKWLIIINADPDAMASAMALKRIMSRRVDSCDIASINEVKRPDNLAMIRYLRIPLLSYSPEMKNNYTHFAMVDSQPHHNTAYAGISFSIVIDHHPPHPDFPFSSNYREIRSDYGSNSTIMTEYLYNLKIRPGKLLATSLMYGIKSDTQSFERNFCDVDIKAFSYLNKWADTPLLKKIVYSEYKKEWLKYFSQAFRKMRFIGREGVFVWMGRMESPDILVILADFFTRVHGLSWVVVCGNCEKKAVAVFRGDGLHRDMGAFSQILYADVGSAGGHKSMARAEIDLKSIETKDVESFFWDRLVKRKPAGF
ncbi:DHH family phosphoesterase [Desulfovibrio inopinatus]|uniref:DHH family phosphoesterase n=1 Tax=Desulfovibrio inopinatus TaxID=102109 RepID=UPI00042063B1|nr:DHH family phosphoesterase [Desulfovibrio inopinatus]